MASITLMYPEPFSIGNTPSNGEFSSVMLVLGGVAAASQIHCESGLFPTLSNHEVYLNCYQAAGISYAQGVVPRHVLHLNWHHKQHGKSIGMVLSLHVSLGCGVNCCVG